MTDRYEAELFPQFCHPKRGEPITISGGLYWLVERGELGGHPIANGRVSNGNRLRGVYEIMKARAKTALKRGLEACEQLPINVRVI
ncbi:MAG: hypothetical protein ABIH92_04930 [Nanoarchaeota archaeon]